MEFKSFFIKNVVVSFFVIYTCVSLTMMLIGFIYEPNRQFGYELFLSPLIFSVISSLPSLIEYSKHELSIRQLIVRKIIHLVVLEILILSTLWSFEIIKTVEMGLSLGISIMIIDITVRIIDWINNKRIADEINHSIKTFKQKFK